jgi:hypothetical protein
MALLQSYMLWGIMGAVLPIAIHFWYQKKGKTIAWAATRWLSEHTTLQHRGIRLHEVWLMLVRCLLVILLALILAKPVLEWLNRGELSRNVHFVAADRLVADSYRFELEKAMKEGDEVYWIDATPKKITDLSTLPSQKGDVRFLQQSVNQLAEKGRKFNFYLRENSDLGKIYVPGEYLTFSARGLSVTPKTPYLDLGGSKRLFVDPATEHLKVAGNESTEAFMPEPVHRGNISVLAQYSNPEEQRTLKAALEALREVYEIPFVIDTIRNSNKHYEWHLHFPLPRGQGVVESAAEWVGESFVDHFGLKTKSAVLSKRQLNALFEKADRKDKHDVLRTQQWLFIGFVLLLMLERWMALRKIVEVNHG